METARTLILMLHIVAGFTALTIGAIPLAAKKGGKLHNATGKVFYYAMLLVAVSAFGLAAYRVSSFLLMVGLFTLYSTVTGYRGLQLMRQQAIRGQWRDWVLLTVSAVVLLFTIWQTIAQYGIDHVSVLVLVSFFGILLGTQLLYDLRVFSGKITMKGSGWIRYHVSRISGAYIATVTAFLVNNVSIEPEFLGWLLPAAIGAPLTAYLQRKYFARRKKVAETKVMI